MLAGALSAPLEAVYEWFSYGQDWDWGYRIADLFILAGAWGGHRRRARLAADEGAGAGRRPRLAAAGQEVREARTV